MDPRLGTTELVSSQFLEFISFMYTQLVSRRICRMSGWRLHDKGGDKLGYLYDIFYND